MGVYTTKTFKSGNSEAIRLPKELAYGEGVELIIERVGDMLRIYPKPKLTIQQMIDKLAELPKTDWPPHDRAKGRDTPDW